MSLTAVTTRDLYVEVNGFHRGLAAAGVNDDNEDPTHTDALSRAWRIRHLDQVLAAGTLRRSSTNLVSD